MVLPQALTLQIPSKLWVYWNSKREGNVAMQKEKKKLSPIFPLEVSNSICLENQLLERNKPYSYWRGFFHVAV